MIPRTLFSEEHELFRQTARRFCETEVAPYHAEWEVAGIVPRELWQSAGEKGLLCCDVPEEYGGPGGDFLMVAIMTEEMARIGATGPAFHLHSGIVVPYITQNST